MDSKYRVTTQLGDYGPPTGRTYDKYSTKAVPRPPWSTCYPSAEYHYSLQVKSLPSFPARLCDFYSKFNKVLVPLKWSSTAKGTWFQILELLLSPLSESACMPRTSISALWKRKTALILAPLNMRNSFHLSAFFGAAGCAFLPRSVGLRHTGSIHRCAGLFSFKPHL